MDKLRCDVVYALRTIRRTPGAAAATILVLGLGIGLTSATFAISDPFLLRPLPYARPHELVTIELRVHPFRGKPVVPTLHDWQIRQDLFQSVAAFRVAADLRLRMNSQTVSLGALEVTENLLAALGVALPDIAAGSTGGSGDLRIAVRSDPPWLSGDAGVLGLALGRQGGGMVRIAAVLPPTFLFPRARQTQVDALIFVQPSALAAIEERADGSVSSTSWTAIARLRDGVSPQAAQEALRASLSGGSALTVNVRSLTSSMRGDVAWFALGAMTAGGLLLLICAANFGTLLLARAAFRERERATREAIGARQRDLVRLLFVELALTTAGGIAVAIAMADIALVLARGVLSSEYAALGAPVVTSRVIAFAWLSGLVVMIVGSMPTWLAWRIAGPGLARTPGISETRTGRSLRIVTASTQSAITVILLSGAALLLRSYGNLAFQDTGFAPDVVVVSASYPSGHIGAPLQADIDRTVERLRRTPGSSRWARRPARWLTNLRTLQIVRASGRAGPVERKHVSAGYFRAVGTPIVQGRSLVEDDRDTGALINESFAKSQWPGEGSVGQQLVLGARPATVVGVVQDTFDIALDRPPEPMIFTLLHEPRFAYRVNYAVRLVRPSESATEALRREIAAVNLEAVFQPTSLRSRLAATVRDRTFATLVLTFFAVAGLGICTAGLIGIISFVVARRTREIAIRMALGATPSRICNLVLRETAGAAIVGGIAGLVGSHWLSRSIESLLYGVAPNDVPATLFAILAMILVVGLASARSTPARGPAGAESCNADRLSAPSRRHIRSRARWALI